MPGRDLGAHLGSGERGRAWGEVSPAVFALAPASEGRRRTPGFSTGAVVALYRPLRAPVDIEEHYLEALARLTLAERMARGQRIFHDARELLARRIRAEVGPVSDDRLRLLVARAMYAEEPDICAWLERELERVGA